mmetsp:Transcript_937/g.1969  ORF Transcript_937/g.1969 Transcript_937/m.1969 type:complete len:421 (-) Transcript_937:1011-2273(-)
MRLRHMSLMARAAFASVWMRRLKSSPIISCRRHRGAAQTTVELRGRLNRSELSPNESPGPSSCRTFPPCSTASLPPSTRNMDRPPSPSRYTVSPSPRSRTTRSDCSLISCLACDSVRALYLSLSDRRTSPDDDDRYRSKSDRGTRMRSAGVRHRAVVTRVLRSSRRLPSPKNPPWPRTASRLSSLSDRISTRPELMKYMASPSSPGRYTQSPALWCSCPSLENSWVKSESDSPRPPDVPAVAASIISLRSSSDRSVPVTLDTTRPRSSPSTNPFDDASKTSNARLRRCVRDPPSGDTGPSPSPAPAPSPARPGPSTRAAKMPVRSFSRRSRYVRNRSSDPARAFVVGVSPRTHGCRNAVIAVRRASGSRSMRPRRKSLADGLRCPALPRGGDECRRILSCISSSDAVPSGSKGCTPTSMM